MSTVGVVIPAYQAGAFLPATLGSLRAQTHADWECVIVDDGSTDGTGRIADEMAAAEPRIRVVHQANAGLSGARNAGLRALGATSEHIMLLDADDLLLPEALEVLVAAVEGRPDAVGASGWAETIDRDGVPIAPGVHAANQRVRRAYRRHRVVVLDPAEDTTFGSLAIQGTIWPPATAITRSAVVRAAGGFDPAAQPREDWDFYLRCARRGPYVFVDRQVAWYRRHPANLSRDQAGYVRNSAVVRRKTWRDPANTTAQSIVLLRANARVLAWIVRRQLDLVPAEIRDGAWGAALTGIGWIAYAMASLVCVVPVVPPMGIAGALARGEARWRTSKGRPAYLEAY